MKKVLMALALLSAVTMANAGNDNANPCGNNGNNCNTGGGSTSTANSSALGVGIGVGYGQGGNSSSVATGGSANATGGNASALGGVSNVDVRNNNTNLNNNANTNVNANTQGQAQSTSNANNSSNSSSTSVNVEGDNFQARRIPVSTAYANAPLPSATCRAGGALGVQSTVLGISFGGDRAVETCEINEAARIAFSIGEKDMATELICQNKWAKKTSQCQALVAAE